MKASVPETTRCLIVQEEVLADGQAGEAKAKSPSTRASIKDIPLFELPAGDVLVRIEYSSLNYKDALATSGNRGVAKSFPLIPGIDAVGEIVECPDSEFQLGQRVFIAHQDFGTRVHGGFSQFARAPTDWICQLPDGLTPQKFAGIGKAGFTAAQSVEQLQKHGVQPDSGPIIVTGATGGVGMFSIRLLSKLGYEVVAVTGKPDRAQWLKDLGAERVISRDEVDDISGKPLLSGVWAGAVDAVGGNILATIIRGLKNDGCATACGVAAGPDLPLTVYPFILRGGSLIGIDSTRVPREDRERLWGVLAAHFADEELDEAISEATLDEIPNIVPQMLAGETWGRKIVRLG